MSGSLSLQALFGKHPALKHAFNLFPHAKFFLEDSLKLKRSLRTIAKLEHEEDDHISILMQQLPMYAWRFPTTHHPRLARLPIFVRKTPKHNEERNFFKITTEPFSSTALATFEKFRFCFGDGMIAIYTLQLLFYLLWCKYNVYKRSRLK